jgi:citrate synthase
MTRQITPTEAFKLMEELQEAHYKAALDNQNISKMAALTVFDGSDNPMNAIAAGLLSTGGIHGPLTETRELLRMYNQDKDFCIAYMTDMVKGGGKIPGLGNSFFKDKVDPAFSPALELYVQTCNDLGEDSLVINFAKDANLAIEQAKGVNKNLYLNASAITAGITELLGGCKYIENWFFIAGRSRAWIEIMATKP